MSGRQLISSFLVFRTAHLAEITPSAQVHHVSFEILVRGSHGIERGSTPQGSRN